MNFVQIYRAYVKKYYLVSQESFIENNFVFSFYLQKKMMKNGDQIFKKNLNTCLLKQ